MPNHRPARRNKRFLNIYHPPIQPSIPIIHQDLEVKQTNGLTYLTTYWIAIYPSRVMWDVIIVISVMFVDDGDVRLYDKAIILHQVGYMADGRHSHYILSALGGGFATPRTPARVGRLLYEPKRSVAAWNNGAHADIERYRKPDSRGQMDMREKDNYGVDNSK
ncbi:hypothetical protein M747DRAFT_327261 [Aspergillus niger ATCC 13496]|uniref:Uncharacterized protein n=1 Tax=Aspergillus niger ATCC 13496 TaxID=1353008 RepID=A0A370CH65_ASPNG|nr:hypothetical protein M747DRAFT_327261 [Aspergillus niger ATCC 13496]